MKYLLPIALLLSGCAPHVVYHRVGVPRYLTDMPAKPTINPKTATVEDTALFIIDLHTDAQMCRQRLAIIQEHYGHERHPH